MGDTQPALKGRKLEILQSAFSAITAHGLPSLTYEVISQHGNVSRQLIRYHYREPEELLTALCDYVASLYAAKFEELNATACESGTTSLDLLLDFFFDQITEMRKPQDDAVINALMTSAAYAPEIKDRLKQQHETLGTLLRNALLETYPELGQQGARELSYLCMSLIYGHWKMVATLGYAPEYSACTRGAADRLIASYRARPARSESS